MWQSRPARRWRSPSRKAARKCSACISCHGPGLGGAPKIGDAKAWHKRAEQGLTSLTQNALNRIRGMPAHGGSPGLSAEQTLQPVTIASSRTYGNYFAMGGAGPYRITVDIRRPGEPNPLQAQSEYAH